jgi:HAD superfamily phosphatase (TIGR01668 family)
MPLFHPTIRYHRVTAVTHSFLQAHGIRALALDVDNTLTTHNNPIPDAEVLAWLDGMKASGVALILLSNNSAKRVRPFAQMLGLGFASRACKPLTFGLARMARRLKLRPKQIALVGDQIFTDVMAGNLFGTMTILVTPMEPEPGPFFRLKRRIEKRILKRLPAERGEG